ncbi:hypothetical protein CCM_00692 [Cordyceps militaris CM01]|uniref:Uncharacterized protein n=1 Tax=Cordyceps militaris (strain CM01) TaxID=983644 RepID=G3J5H6_CORMM|nr:uncharacterized protein CCM_00692 [Cordyceps militaris CM01]EGX96037.1 hypothetical protein CCM_00692 [Cordyceps militaris CM01]
MNTFPVLVACSVKIAGTIETLKNPRIPRTSSPNHLAWVFFLDVCMMCKELRRMFALMSWSDTPTLVETRVGWGGRTRLTRGLVIGSSKPSAWLGIVWSQGEKGRREARRTSETRPAEQALLSSCVALVGELVASAGGSPTTRAVACLLKCD